MSFCVGQILTLNHSCWFACQVRTTIESAWFVNIRVTNSKLIVGWLPHRIHGAAIYGNIYHQYTPNVSIYTSTMDPMGTPKFPFFWPGQITIFFLVPPGVSRTSSLQSRDFARLTSVASSVAWRETKTCWAILYIYILHIYNIYIYTWDPTYIYMYLIL
jgi:hypothetical protein